MDVTIRIKRYDPEAENPESYWQDFSFTLDDTATILDGLIKIREEIDGTLSLRCSCRSSICGSCARQWRKQCTVLGRPAGLPIGGTCSAAQAYRPKQWPF